MQVFSEHNVHPNLLSRLKQGTFSLIGYGSQGRAQALCLRDNGIRVVIAQRPYSPRYDQAVKDGFSPTSIKEAVCKGDIIHVLTPDSSQGNVYQEGIHPHLDASKSLVFSHGYSLHYGHVTPPKDVDVYMLAPKAIGPALRERFLQKKKVPYFIAIHQNASSHALDTARIHATLLSSVPVPLVETSVQEETFTDLFSEQAVLCGGLTALIVNAYEVLTQKGISPEVAYFECLYELKFITDLIHQHGIVGMLENISSTATYGAYSFHEALKSVSLKKVMQETFDSIQNGTFNRSLLRKPEKFHMQAQALKAHGLEAIGKRLRKQI